MADSTTIEWCDRTWSPWEGCQKAGPGCDRCYAEAMNLRFAKGRNWGPGAPRRYTADWTKPRLWNRQAARDGIRIKVFPSICDPFDNEVDPAWRADLFALIAATPRLDWLLLTKRIGNAKRMIDEALDALAERSRHGLMPFPARWPWSNVWLGATVVSQTEADRDVVKLLTTPAARRFVSIEPMLGPVDLTEMQPPGRDAVWVDAMRGSAAELAGSGPSYKVPRLDWVIVGGESGHGARSMVLGWAKDIVRQCQAAGVPVMVKQLGAKPTNREGEPHRITDRKGGDINEWPVELRVREFPQSAAASEE